MVHTKYGHVVPEIEDVNLRRTTHGNWRKPIHVTIDHQSDSRDLEIETPLPKDGLQHVWLKLAW